MNILGYTYDADIHCVECTVKRHRERPSVSDTSDSETDEHGLPISAQDNEGNDIHPVFSTDDLLDSEDCGAEL